VRATLYFLRNRHLQRTVDPGEIDAVLESGAGPYWLDLEAFGPEDQGWLSRRFKFHPLAVADLLQPNFRPRFEEYEGHLFVIAHWVQIQQDEPTAHEIECFLTQDCLVTAHSSADTLIDRVRKTVEGENGGLARGADHVLYLIVDAVADSFFDVADFIDDQIDDLEAVVLESPSRVTLDRIFALRRGLALLRRYASPLRDAINAIQGHEGGYIRRGNALYFRDVQNLMVTVHEMVDNQRDLTTGVLDVYLSNTSNRLNDVVKRLTIVSSVFLPISFVASVFGTNFVTLIPYESTVLFGLFLAVLFLAPAAMLLWFRRLGWL
jgi:magnesium transporter